MNPLVAYRLVYPEQIENQRYISSELKVDFESIVEACDAVLQNPQETPQDLRERISAFVHLYIKQRAFCYDELIAEKVKYNPRLKTDLIDELMSIFSSASQSKI